MPIALVQSNIIPKAIAADINKERANEHIRANGLTEQITTRFSNGLSGSDANDERLTYCHSRNGRRACYILVGETVCRSKELILRATVGK